MMNSAEFRHVFLKMENPGAVAIWKNWLCAVHYAHHALRCTNDTLRHRVFSRHPYNGATFWLEWRARRQRRPGGLCLYTDSKADSALIGPASQRVMFPIGARDTLHKASKVYSFVAFNYSKLLWCQTGTLSGQCYILARFLENIGDSLCSPEKRGPVARSS